MRQTLILLIFIFEGLFFIVSKANAVTSYPVTATVKISVCGNNIAEGGEDCDNADLKGKTCVSLGYGGGTLSCDISCSFDTSKCISPSPTPTPLSGAAPSSAKANSQNNISSNNNSSTPLLKRLILPLATPACSVLPSALASFVGLKCGEISTNQLPGIVKKWVTSFTVELGGEFNTSTKKSIGHKACDINNDGVCDIKDLSIILFYTKS